MEERNTAAPRPIRQVLLTIAVDRHGRMETTRWQQPPSIRSKPKGLRCVKSFVAIARNKVRDRNKVLTKQPLRSDFWLSGRLLDEVQDLFELLASGAAKQFEQNHLNAHRNGSRLTHSIQTKLLALDRPRADGVGDHKDPEALV